MHRKVVLAWSCLAKWINKALVRSLHLVSGSGSGSVLFWLRLFSWDGWGAAKSLESGIVAGFRTVNKYSNRLWPFARSLVMPFGTVTNRED